LRRSLNDLEGCDTVSALTSWLKLKLVREDVDLLEGEPEERWLIMLGNEVSLLNDQTRFDGIVVGEGKTKLLAKHDAAHRLRDFAHKIDWGTL